jgi:dTDP-4-amino-4,6-dideoxygalactose transaminase
MADMRALRDLADERGLTLLEDAAQAHGAKRDGATPGTVGELAAYSFYPTKNLGALGEGGLVTTNDDALAARVRELRDHGSPKKYEHASLGMNSRLQGIQGAALRVKLPHLERWNENRRRTAALYDEAFRESAEVRPLAKAPSAVHAYHQYTVRLHSRLGRDDVQRALAAEGIPSAVHYPSPVHLQEAARPWGYRAGDFPHAEALAREVLCLPVHPFLSSSDAERVAETLLRVARG